MSTVGLCFTISHASSLIPTQEVTVKNTVVMTQIFPAKNLTRYKKPEQFLQIFDKPLVRIPLQEMPLEPFKQPKKKNQFFEMATVFNDKLQQLISSFTVSEPNYHVMSSDSQHAGQRVCNESKT